MYNLLFCNFLVFNQLSFCFFLYEKRPVSLRRSPRFSTMIALFLYESLSACFQYFTSPFSLPTSSFLFCQNLSHVILSISFFFFFSRTRIRMRVYIIMCSSFSLSFPVSFFMFYNTFANQRLTKKFSFYSKITPDIFCLYCKKVYFCIRLARGAKLLSLT